MPTTLSQCHQIVSDIEVALANTAARLQQLATQIAQLETDGVFDAIPSPSWETRNGNDTQYLRLIFPTTGGNRRKQYVGCDPIKIAAADAKIERTKDRQYLQVKQAHLHRCLHRARGHLASARSTLVTT